VIGGELSLVPKRSFPSFPNSCLGTRGPKLRFACWPTRETEFREQSIPNGVWEGDSNVDANYPKFTYTVFTSVYSSNAYSPNSLPNPLILNPPNGAAASKTS